MKTYSLNCRNIQIVLVHKSNNDKVIRGKSNCANCVAEKSRFLKQ